MKLWLACGPALVLGGREGLSTRGRGGLQSSPRSSNQSSTEPPPSHSWLYNVNEQLVDIELKLKRKISESISAISAREFSLVAKLSSPSSSLDSEVVCKKLKRVRFSRCEDKWRGLRFDFFFLTFSLFLFSFPLFLCSQPMSLSLQEGNNFLGWSTKKEMSVL